MVRISADAAYARSLYDGLVKEITQGGYTECQGLFFKPVFSTEDIATKFVFPSQWADKISGKILHQDYSAPAGFLERGMWHSHNNMSAFHSSADNRVIAENYTQLYRNYEDGNSISNKLRLNISTEGNNLYIRQLNRCYKIELPDGVLADKKQVKITEAREPPKYFSWVTNFNHSSYLEEIVNKNQGNYVKQQAQIEVEGEITEELDKVEIIKDIGEKLHVDQSRIKIKDHPRYKKQYNRVLANYSSESKKETVARQPEKLPLIEFSDSKIIDEKPKKTEYKFAENLDQVINRFDKTHNNANDYSEMHKIISNYDNIDREQTYYLFCLGYLFIANDHPKWNMHYKTLDRLADEIPFSKLTARERQDYLKVFSLAASDNQLNKTRHKKVKSLINKLSKKIEAVRGSRLNDMLSSYPSNDSKSVFIWNFSQLVYADPINYTNYRTQRKEWNLSYQIVLQHMQEVDFKSNLSSQDIGNLEIICNSVSELSSHMPRKMRKSLKNLTKKVKRKMNIAKSWNIKQGDKNAK